MTPNTPFVTVVIPTYNRAHCVCEAIDSVLSQNFQDFELIVVDDGSTDNTDEILTSYKDRLRFIRQENGGVSAARNTGIKAAKGQWIAFLDSDDIWLPDKLNIQVEGIKEFPDALAHMIDAIIADGNGKEFSIFEVRGLGNEFRMRPFRNRPLIDVLRAQFFTPCWMLRRKEIDKLGYFDEGIEIFEDYDLLTRFALEGAFLVSCCPGVKIRRMHGGCRALSDQYQTSRLRALKNLIHIYNNLKMDSRLNQEERRRVCRELSGVRHEKAMEEKKIGAWRVALKTTYDSVADDIGLRSASRAFFSWTGIYGPLTRFLATYRKERVFRRSEFEKVTHFR